MTPTRTKKAGKRSEMAYCIRSDKHGMLFYTTSSSVDRSKARFEELNGHFALSVCGCKVIRVKITEIKPKRKGKR